MAAVVLECSQHGDFDSFDVIRSDTSMVGLADNALPVPIATGLQTMYYVDTALVEGQTYYYRFRVWHGNIALVSDEEVSVTTTIYDPDMLIYMPFSSDIFDHSQYTIPVTTYGSVPPTIQNGALYVPSGSGLILNTLNHQGSNVGTRDFEFGIEFALMPNGNGLFPCVFGVGTSWEPGALSMQLNSSTSNFMVAVRNPDEKDAFAPSSMVIDGMTFASYKVTRIAGVLTTYKKNTTGEFIAGTPINDNLSINLSKNGTITIGIALWSTSITQTHSLIRNLYFKVLE